MDYFAEERKKSAEEIVAYLPDTIYSAATFEGVLTKKQVREFRQSVKKMLLTKDRKQHVAFRKLIRLGMTLLKKGRANLKKQGYSICAGDKGCNNCCRRLTIVTSKLEVLAIEHWAKTIDRETQRLLQESLDRATTTMESCLLAMGVTKEPIPNMATPSIGVAYAECGGFCPALGPTGNCLIYPVRPWSCRTYRALSPSCRSGIRVNLARFPDIDVWMLNQLEKLCGETRTTLFPVIRKALEVHTAPRVDK